MFLPNSLYFLFCLPHSRNFCSRPEFMVYIYVELDPLPALYLAHAIMQENPLADVHDHL